MDLAVTVAFIPDGVDVEAGLQALESLDDRVLIERSDAGLLGWGWTIPGEDELPRPWADDVALIEHQPSANISQDLAGRYLVAVRQSLAVGVRNAAMLLAGKHAWFESRVVTRVPLASGGEMVLFPEDASAVGGESLSDIARLPVEILPEVGRAMGVYGPEAVHVSIAVRS